MILYPQLARAISKKLVSEYQNMSLPEIKAKSTTSHESVEYSPVGGTRVSAERLGVIQGSIRDIAARHGYPDNSVSKNVDYEIAVYLYQNMGLSNFEAANPFIWEFMTCCLLPDFVAWRFHDKQYERFYGNKRRNTFQRCWLRARTLSDPLALEADKYRLIKDLGEDELVQLMERPEISCNPVLSRAIASVLLKNYATVSKRSDLMRDAMKRIRRLRAVISFEGLPAETLSAQINNCFVQAKDALGL